MEIKIDHIENTAVQKLLQEHHDDMLQHSPIESVHALDLSTLKAAGITFYTAWINNELAGCAALNKLDDKHVELKSMKTASSFLRKGVAAKLLTYLLEEAKNQAYEKISLETGTAKAFTPAQNLYKRFDFMPCQPFFTYQEDPSSMFFTKELSDSNAP
jgi:putative acetyltransferase